MERHEVDQKIVPSSRGDRTGRSVQIVTPITHAYSLDRSVLLKHQQEYSTMTGDISQEPSLPEIITRWQQKQIQLNGTEIQLTIPADPDELLQHVDQSEEGGEESFDPYWGHLWPAARKMSKKVF